MPRYVGLLPILDGPSPSPCLIERWERVWSVLAVLCAPPVPVPAKWAFRLAAQSTGRLGLCSPSISINHQKSTSRAKELRSKPEIIRNHQKWQEMTRNHEKCQKCQSYSGKVAVRVMEGNCPVTTVKRCQESMQKERQLAWRSKRTHHTMIIYDQLWSFVCVWRNGISNICWQHLTTVFGFGQIFARKKEQTGFSPGLGDNTKLQTPVAAKCTKHVA